VVKQLIAVAEKEKWPPIRLMVSEEVAGGTHGARRAIYEFFMPVLKKVAPEKMIMLDNSVGFGRKDEVDCGHRDQFPVRQYNSWTKKAIADAKRDGAEVRSYNYDMYRAAWGFEQQRLNSNGHHAWADQWGQWQAVWTYSKIDEKGHVTSSVQYERIREGRFDYLYCNTLKYYVDCLKQAGKGETGDILWRDFLSIIADMPVGRPGFFYWKDTHSAEDLDLMRMFVIQKINEARCSLGEKVFMPVPPDNGIIPHFSSLCRNSLNPNRKKSDSSKILYAPQSDDILIDADLNEAVWTGADNSTGPLKWIMKKEIDLKCIAGSKGIEQPEPAEVAAAYNSKGLIFGINAKGSSDYNLLRIGREFGGDNVEIWRDDNIEIMFVNKINNELFNLFINSDGHKALISGTRAVIPSKTITISTSSTDGGYKQEILIPWKLLGLKEAPSPGTVWAMNIGREYHTKDQITSWGRVIEHFSETKYWGKIKFTGNSGNLSVSLNQNKIYPGNNILSGTIISKNGKPVEIPQVILMTGSGRKLNVKSDIKKTDMNSAEFKLEFSLPENENIKTLKLTLLGNTGIKLGEMTIPVSTSKQRLSIINAPELVAAGANLNLNIELQMGNADITGQSIKGQFTSDTGETIEMVPFPLKNAGECVLSINTSGLHSGRWVLRLWVSGDRQNKCDSVKLNVLPSINNMK
jgi:hypothetical protein